MSDAKDRVDERGKDLCNADFGGMIVQAVWGQATVCDARVPNAIPKDLLALPGSLGQQPTEHVIAAAMPIEILPNKAFAVGAKPGHTIQMTKDACGRDLEHARASNGMMGGQLQEFVTDVSSKWPLDTGTCGGSCAKFEQETAPNPSM